MSDFIRAIIDWIVSLFGGKTDPEAIELTKPCMPLFYVNEFGDVASTWDYIAKSELGRKYCRDAIKAVAVADEQHCILFLICNTPPDIVAAAARECVKDGIAVIGTLYVDDPPGPDKNNPLPAWWEISKHVENWKAVHEKAGKYMSGYVLSIETNEMARNVAHINACMGVMRDTMPGVQIYATHLEWNGASKISSYRWVGGSSTPSMADAIIVELCGPSKGDAIGVNGIKNIWNKVVGAEKRAKLAPEEYNLNPDGVICWQQRDWLRSQNPWGVG